MQFVETNRQKWPRSSVLLVFALAMAVRLIMANVFPLDMAHDPDAYLQLGANLRWNASYDYRSDPSSPELAAHRPPLYPLLVAGCMPFRGRNLFMLVTAHVVMGAATAALVFRIAEQWMLSKRAALFAAALVVFDPILLNQSVQPMTETLAAFLSALGLLVLASAGSRLSLRWSILAGSTLALAELCRPTFMVWLLVSGLALVVLARTGRQRLAIGCAFALSAALVISPWAVRNYRLFGRPIITTTHGGFTLALANNPKFYQHLSKQGWFVPWSETEFTQPTRAHDLTNLRLESEMQMDRDRYAEAIQAIRAQPGMFFVSCAYRLGRLWGVCPMATDPLESAGHRWLRYGVAVFYLFEFALAGWGAWLVGRNWLRSPWLWGLLLVLSFTAVHTFYWTDMRMRAPFIPVIALAAAAALSGNGWRLDGQGLAAQGVADTQSAANLP